MNFPAKSFCVPLKDSLGLKFLVFMFFMIIGHAQEEFDVETLPEGRTQKYSFPPYEKLVVFSSPRTGSSLTYNVCRFLFEETENLSKPHNGWTQDRLIYKTHQFDDLDKLTKKNILYVVTVRNPLDSIISHYRVMVSKVTNIREFVRRLVLKNRDCMNHIEDLKRDGCNVLIVKYEELDGNLDYLFNLIEEHLAISIAKQDKELMEKGYAKENINASTEVFPDFEDCLPTSGFHGAHVSLEPYTPPEELLYWVNNDLRLIKPIFKRYGYFQD